MGPWPPACWAGASLCSPDSTNRLLENTFRSSFRPCPAWRPESPRERPECGCDEGRRSAAGVGFRSHVWLCSALMSGIRKCIYEEVCSPKSLVNSFFDMKMPRNEVFWAAPRLPSI